MSQSCPERSSLSRQHGQRIWFDVSKLSPVSTPTHFSCFYIHAFPPVSICTRLSPVVTPPPFPRFYTPAFSPPPFPCFYTPVLPPVSTLPPFPRFYTPPFPRFDPAFPLFLHPPFPQTNKKLERSFICDNVLTPFAIVTGKHQVLVLIGYFCF